MGSFPMKVSFVWPFPRSSKMVTSYAPSMASCSIPNCAGSTLVSLRVRKVHGGNDLLVQNNLVVFTRIPELLPIGRSHAAEKFSSHSKIHLANRRSKTLRSPPLHHVLRVCPRLPNQLAWGIKNSCDNHPLNFANRVFCHLWPPLSSFDLQRHPVCRNSLPRIGDS